MNRWSKFVGGFGSVGVIVILAMVLWPSKPPIPGPVKAQVSTTLLAPQGGGYAVDRQSAHYDTKLQLLSYTAKAGNATVTISEQPEPSQFSDITGYYQQVLTGMNQYASFGSTQGTVYLTKPGQANGLQVAVLDTKGTLMFAKSTAPWSQDDWQRFFRSVAVIR